MPCRVIGDARKFLVSRFWFLGFLFVTILCPAIVML